MTTSARTLSVRSAASNPSAAPASSPLAKRMAASSISVSAGLSPNSMVNRLEGEKPLPPEAGLLLAKSILSPICGKVSAPSLSFVSGSPGSVGWKSVLDPWSATGTTASLRTLPPEKSAPCGKCRLAESWKLPPSTVASSCLPFHHCLDIWASISSIFLIVLARSSRLEVVVVPWKKEGRPAASVPDAGPARRIFRNSSNSRRRTKSFCRLRWIISLSACLL